jgi:flagella synthesis protein FlgN
VGELAARLHAECAAFATLCGLLEREQRSLIHADAEALLEVSRLKSEEVDRLGVLAQQRLEHLFTAGFDGGPGALNAWLARQPDAAELNALWQQLTALATQARSLNDTNGKLISTRLSHNQAALAALQVANRALNVYGPDGHAPVSAGQRELGKA